MEAAVTKLKAHIDLENIEIDINIVDKIIQEIIACEGNDTNAHNKINTENKKSYIKRIKTHK